MEAVLVQRDRDCRTVITLGCLMREKARRAPYYLLYTAGSCCSNSRHPKVIIRQRAEGLMETRRLQALLCKLIFCWTSQATSCSRNFINLRNWILVTSNIAMEGFKLLEADLDRVWFALAKIGQLIIKRQNI